MTGRRLGPYEFVEKLGQGGMGEVWKARDTRLNRMAAIKILPAAQLSTADQRQRFLQEAQTASALNHPNIITIYGIDRDGDTDYIAMEYVKGSTLERLIPRKGLPLKTVLEYGAAIASGLAAAHATGIVHRDLKPGNVMVRDDGQLKVLDFGLAKLAQLPAGGEDQATETVGVNTEAGAIVGTISYMSPEQAEGKPVDARSDIFSFGALLYEMVTGRRAFLGDSKLSTLTAIMRDSPKPAGEIAEGLPRELDRLIERCLRKDPARRFQSMLDLKVVLEDLKQDSESGTLQSPVAPLSRRRPVWVYPVAIALVALVAAGGWLTARRSKGAPEPELKITPFSFYAGSYSSPAFSPDGRQMAFTWNGEKQDNTDIYVKMISTGSQLRLTTSPAADIMPAWSPDGSYIAFVRADSQGRRTIFLISPLGGAERRVAEYGGVAGIDWSPDGKWLVVAAGKTPQAPFSLFLISPETGEQRQLTTGSRRGDIYPAFSPDGHTVAFAREVVDLSFDVFVQDLTDGMAAKGAPHRLELSPEGFISGIAWTPDGRWIVYGRITGNVGLWRVAAAGGSPPERLPFGNTAAWPAIARRGNAMAYSVSTIDTNIWELPLRSPGVTGGPPLRLIASVKMDQNAHISPDGRRIVFESSRDGKSQLWMANRDGSNQQPLVSVGSGTTGSGSWSPDGSRLAFDGRPAGHGSEIWTISADGGAPRRLTDTQFDSMVPSWSGDGKSIYFVSNRTGRFEVFKMAADGGSPAQMTHQGGWFAQESPDGKTLYYQKDRGAFGGVFVWKMPVEGGEEVEIPGIRASERAWQATSDGIYFIDPQPVSTLKYLEFSTGKIRSLTQFEKPTFYGVSVAPDGRSILYSQIDSHGSEIMLVENFR